MNLGQTAGAEVSPRDSRDWYLEDLGMSSEYTSGLPEEYMFDLPHGLFNQGVRHTCGACVGALLVEIHEAMSRSSVGPETRRNKSKRLSSEFIYHHRVNTPARGMFGRDIFRILKNLGVSTEEKHPSDGSEENDPAPSRDAYRSASYRRIIGYVRVSTMYCLQKAIAEIGPAYMLLPYSRKHAKFWQDAPRAGTECHAVAVVGYNKKGFIIVNSWGRSWGFEGYEIFPYDDWDCVREVWVPLYRKDAAKKQSFAGAPARFIRESIILGRDDRADGNSCC